ncbi:hypothetical protein [Polynucleobacter necessarius]|nr:hypothetical protein [Polynucleobacter necessarius]
MKKILSTLAVGSLVGIGFSAAHADPQMQPVYASVMKMAPEGNLGQVIQ